MITSPSRGLPIAAISGWNAESERASGAASGIVKAPAIGVSPLHRAGLSRAERAVAHCLKYGLSNKEASVVLGKAPATIKHQTASLLRKLGVPSRARAMAIFWTLEVSAQNHGRDEYCILCDALACRARFVCREAHVSAPHGDFAVAAGRRT